MAKMSDDDLLNQISILERQALGYYQSEIAGEQSRALDFYNSKPFGNEEEGRSQVQSSDVWDVVEGLTPIVLKPFVSSDDVVKFNPLAADDEEAAEQESDYINWVVTQRNDNFNQLVSAVKTGLLQKNAVAKYWWEQSERPTIERYSGLTEDQFAMLAGEKSVKIVQHSEQAQEVVGPDGMPVQVVMHDVVLRTVEEVGMAKYRVIAPEEFVISRDADSTNPQDARFVQHRQMRTIGDLRAMGYDVDDDINEGLDDDPTASEQYLARREHETMGGTEHGLDASAREVLYKETYILVDQDDDGIPELRKVCSVGDVVLMNEETEEIPFVAWTPYPQPFRFWGRCPADETIELQLIKSTLWRQMLDNIYTINNNRVFAGNKVNLSDLVDNQIAGVVRVDSDNIGGQVMPAPITPIGAIVQPMIEYIDSAKENRTGFTRYNQGTDSSSLNKTATGVRLITEAANGRVEIIARAFAEQFLAPLMRGIHGLVRRHATKDETVRLRGKWVNVDPRGWKRRIDLTVSVGLGTADQQMKMQGLQALMMEQKQLMQVGLAGPKELHAAALKFAEVLGFKNADQFFSQPKEQEGLPPQVQQALQAAQQQLQEQAQEIQQLKSGVAAKQMDVQAKMQSEQMKAQLEREKLQAQMTMADKQDDLKRDLAELAGVVQLLSKQVQVPQQLEQAVSEDLSEDEEPKETPEMMIARVLERMTMPKTKRMRIMAPSGQVYEGEVSDGEMVMNNGQ